MSYYYSVLTLGLCLLSSFGCFFANASDQETPNTYVRVVYDTHPQSVVYYDFNECYPYEINGAPALYAVWLKSTTCVNYRRADCTGVSSLPLPVPGGSVLVNAADFVKIVGDAALCKENKDLPPITPLTGNGL